VNDKSNLFHGNSLGLQPKRTRAYVDEVMDDWANLAVEGHFMLKSLGGIITSV
jgi:kynureninase